MTRVLVTGASGFVGSTLCRRLRADGYAVRAAMHTATAPGSSEVFIGDLTDDTTDWRAACRDVDTVVHLAARVHVMHDTERDPLTAFRRLNVDASLRLAQHAAEAGVRRLIYVSSIKVNGETSRTRPFTADDPPAPKDPYAISKWEAEQGLLAQAQRSGLEVVVIRPPLVYGPRVKGNFLRLLRLVNHGLPLPFGALHNRRSLIGIDNLCDLLARSVQHPDAANQVFLAADGVDLSTRALVVTLAEAMQRRPRLIALPPTLLRAAATVSGRSAEIQRLCDPLQVDIRKTQERLEWKPPVCPAEALQETVHWFRSDASSND